MAIGKARGSKRPPGGSCSSTATVLVFVFVCLFGIWMLTSNSIISPQKKSMIRKASSAIDSAFVNAHYKTNLPRKIPTHTTTVFEDNPGDLPMDAIKSDDDFMVHDREMDHTSKHEDQNTGDHEPKETDQHEHEHEITSNVVEDVEASDNIGKQKPTTLITGVKENHHGLQENVTRKKEQNHKTEDTGKSYKRHTEKMITANKSIEHEADQRKKNIDHRESSTKKQDHKRMDANEGDENDHMTDEEQEKRMEHQQEDEEAQQQTQKGEVSDDQVHHDDDTIIGAHSVATETKDRVRNQEAKEQMEQDNISTTINTTASKNDTKTKELIISSGIPNESKDTNNQWSTQADQSTNQKGRRRGGGNGGVTVKDDVGSLGYKWELCNVTSGADYIPCLDNEKAIKELRGRNHFEHRERHCPDEGPTCLVPLPEGYKTPLPWPQSRDKIWFHNVPHKALTEVKGHQNWVKLTGEFLTFPGGGTQFIHGALHYIDFVQQIVPDIEWGKHTKVILDVGCGVASFGGYMFDRNVLTMSFAPKDEHQAQVQFALERGIPAISAVMGTQRLPFPSRVFDLVHCARCRVPWHREGGKLLLELNRVLRPGAYFVWSATPVYQKRPEDIKIWKEMSALTVAMCWELISIKNDKLNAIGVAVYQKPESNECYDGRKKQEPPMCKPDDDPNASWYVPLQTCLHKVPIMETERGSQWPEEWPARVQMPPYWLNKTQMGIYGKPAPDDFEADYENWKRVVSKTYMSGLEISWSNVRNVMDMRAVYGGFAAALKDLKLWVLNVVNIDSPDTLPIIYERGLFGIYHDWCESFSTYPRTYDLLHADHLFSKLKKRCKITPVIAEVDRIVRPGGKLIIRDEYSMLEEIKNLLKSLHWEVHLTSKKQEQILSAQKSSWRPKTYATP